MLLIVSKQEVAGMTLLQGTSKLAPAAGRSSVRPEQHSHLYLLLKNTAASLRSPAPQEPQLPPHQGAAEISWMNQKNLFYERALESSASRAAEQEGAQYESQASCQESGIRAAEAPSDPQVMTVEQTA